MATVYSLICWGGKDGKTITSINSSTDVITLSNHGLRSGMAVVPQSTVSGVTSGTTYYSGYISSSTFYLYDTEANALAGGATGRINLTATTTFTLKSAYYTGLSDKSRWTYSAVEYIFDGIVAWNTHRTSTVPASPFDIEVAEVGEEFNDIVTSAFAFTIPSAQSIVTSELNGTRSAAWHGGSYPGANVPTVIDKGYTICNTGTLGSADFITTNRYNDYIEGVNIGSSATFGVGSLVRLNKGNSGVRNCFIIGNTGFPVGVTMSAPLVFAIGNVVKGCSSGINVTNNQAGLLAANNICVGNTTGMNASTSPFGYYYNNISLGNTTNWAAATLTNVEGSSNNAGLSGEAWIVGSGTRVTMATTDFLNYAGNVFSPALSTSPQVNAGVNFYGYPELDITDDLRPAYEDGTDVVDIGAYEWDFGNTPPAVRALDLSGLVAGSQVVVYTSGTTTELDRDDAVVGSTYSYDAGTTGVTVDFTVMKAGMRPIRVTGVSLAAESNPVTVSQDLDRAYITPSGLTFGTNAVVNVSGLAVTSVQVTTATTVQNWYSYLIDCWLDTATNTTLKNVPFPVIPFGEASFTLIDGIEFSDGATSVAYFSRDGLRYSSDDGATETAVWAAILTLDTPAGFQVKYRTSGGITNAANTGPMDQLVQVYGDPSHGNFDYRGAFDLRCPKPGYSQPIPDLVATYGNLFDGLFVAGLEPILQYATTDADLDAANLALDNTAKTYTVTANHTLAELYQRAQWWANQDAQWDADIPLTTTDGNTFTMPSTWTLVGPTFVSGGTLVGGKVTLAAGSQSISFSGMTITLGSAGTYTFSMVGSSTVIATPAAPGTYVMSSGTFIGTVDLRNASGTHAITVQLPSGTTYTTANNTGAAITVEFPAVTATVTIGPFITGSRVQLYDTTNNVELFNDVVAGTSKVYSETYTVDRTVRARVSYVSGVTAKSFIEVVVGTITSGSPNISATLSQVDDTTYNTNAIDGSTVTGITFTDAATDVVNINLAGGATTWPSIYAAFVYWISTATGIADDIAYINAVDTANYILTSMVIKNTSSPTVPLVISSGYGRDATTGASIDLVDTSGGTLIFAPDHVVAYSSGSGLTAGQDAALIAIKAKTDSLGFTVTGQVDANIQYVNDVQVSGTGATGNEWGPV